MSIRRVIAPLSILFAAFFSSTLIQPASAHITGISAPKTPLNPGDSFNATFHTAGFIENNLEYYAICGLAPLTLPEFALWELLGTGYNLVTNGRSRTGSGAFNIPLTIPMGFTPSGSDAVYRLTVAVVGTVSPTIYFVFAVETDVKILNTRHCYILDWYIE